MTVAAEPQAKPTTVLVIEDDQEINELLGEYLTLEQIGYVSALNGTVGLEQAAAIHPDAVILDLMLPDIDGYEIARRITRHRATFDIPVLMLTCMNQDCDRHKGFACGALHFMNKPFLPDDLLGVLRQALEWRAGLYTRPPQATITVSTASPTATLCQLNNMMAELFARTALSDPTVEQIREAFENLMAWALEWGEKNQQDPGLEIGYRILAADGELASATAAPASVEWTLSEKAPGLLAAAFFKPAEAAPIATSGFSLTQWAFGGRGAAAPTAELAAAAPETAGTAANWYVFLGKTGAAHFDKDSATQTVRLTRPLTGEHGLPVVSADGSRSYPHRLRDEALAAKRK